ncbi:hypothetical protein LCGC14_2468280, partial [marine sediment metagenome]
MKIFDKIYDAIVNRNRDEVIKLAGEVRDRGIDPAQAIEKGFKKGMEKIGEQFADLEIFIPDMIAAAEIMNEGLDILRPLLKSTGAKISTGRILLGTIQGDVHEIGKNIVKIMLEGSGYEVIDLGLMVPCEKILQTAKSEGVDMIGLSGLITPSLDEMVHVAGEMERQGFDVPLLIGGATTSAKHTAVKIAPAYRNATVHVLDASRSVGVVDRLKSDDRRAGFEAKNRQEQEALVASFNLRQQVQLVPYA